MRTVVEGERSDVHPWRATRTLESTFSNVLSMRHYGSEARDKVWIGSFCMHTTNLTVVPVCLRAQCNYRRRRVTIENYGLLFLH